MPDTVMIVAGESSGELYGALLATALRQKVPDIKLIGIGGQRMQEAGVTLLSGISGAFGIIEAVSAIKSLRETFRAAVACFRTEKPAVVVLIDYPDFNLKLAERARAFGIKVLYYVSPQVWVWRKNRIHRIAKLVDRMAVILPFEPEIYKETGLSCEFVGHPALDEIEALATDKKTLKEELGLQPERPLLSLLPGSRTHEIDRLLPLIEEVASSLSAEQPLFQFCIPFAPNTNLLRYADAIQRLKNKGVVINQGRSLQVLSVSEAAVVASGTATLQAAFLGVPGVVIYKVSPVTYVIGRLILSGRFITLANILSRREVVKELIQQQATVENVMKELRRITGDRQYRAAMLKDFAEVRGLFSSRQASARVAEMAMEMLGRKLP